MSRAASAATTRARVLEAARTTFVALGYAGATMRAIAQAASLSTGAIVVHFGDKAALYRSVYGHDPLTPEEGRAWRERALAAEARR